MTDDLDRLPVLQALEAELARVRTAAAGTAPRGRLLRVATPATAAILAAAMALTPGGRALAERIGELVGIGDEPTRNSVALIDEPAVVIGAGESPNGTAYEVVASADMNIYRDESPDTCIGIDFPGIDAPSNAGCLTGELSRSIDERVITATAFLGSTELGHERLIVDGLASPEVASAEIEWVAENGSIERHPVAVSHLTGELARDIGASREAAFLLAFLPEDLVPPPPSATDSQPSFAVPAPAPGTIPDSPGAGSEAGPLIGRDIPPVSLPGDRDDSPARAALARLSVVAYDGDGSEIARQSLARQPFSDVTLYSAENGTAADARDQAVVEGCFREILPRYGTPGEIAPQLPSSFGEELGDCLERAGRPVR